MANAIILDTTKSNVLDAIQTTPVSSAGNNDEAFVGPLATLDQLNQYRGSYYVYPRDLGSSQKLHSVVFKAYEIDSSDFTVSDVKDALVSKTGDFATGIRQTTEDVLNNPTEKAAELYDKTVNETEKFLNSDGQAIRNAAKPPIKKEVTDIITLYMPDNAEFNYGANYNQIGLLEAAASVPVLGAIPNAILSTLNNAAARVLLNSMGYVFNPQEQVLFEGINFRTFSMSFTLTPFSAPEANEIKNIIKAFRRNAAPTIASGGAGFFFIPPSVFDVTFMYGNSENPNINKLKRCVLTDVNVNYAPNGTWSTHNDGSPVQTGLTLSFKEIELVDRKDVESGY